MKTPTPYLHRPAPMALVALFAMVALSCVCQSAMADEAAAGTDLVDAGGTAIHVGILTAIMLGGSSFTQLRN